MVGVTERILRKLLQSNSGEKAKPGHLVGCKSINGRSKKFERRIFSKSMVKLGTIVKSQHQFAGIASCSRRSEESGPAGRPCQTPPRQHNCLLLHKKAGRNQKLSAITGGLPSVERILGERREPPGPPMVVHQGQRGGGLFVKERHSLLGDRVGKVCVSDDTRDISSSTYPGCFCIKRNSSTFKIHELVQRRSCSGNGCLSARLGSSNLSVPSSSIDNESSSKSSLTRNSCSVGLSTVANSIVVANGGGNVGGSSHSSSALQGGSQNDVTGGETTIHGTTGCSSHFRSAYEVTHSSSSLDQQDLEFLSNHLSSGTQSGYGYVFKRFQEFCKTIGQDPFICDPVIIVKYIRSIYDNGAAYSTVNLHRSCISKFHAGYGSISAGAHPLVSQAVKAVFRLRPPLPKYVHTFDISLVFAYISSLPPNKELSLKLLSWKTLFLLTSSTISRLSSLARLGSQLLVFEVSKYLKHNCVIILKFNFQDHCILSFTSLEKQGRPGNIRGYLRVLRFIEDPNLCPVEALVCYHEQV